MTSKERYLEWLNSPAIDDETKSELRKIEGNDTEIEERFYKDLEFGTGGLRGIIGAGTNRMNIYTLRKATQGLANYINKVAVKDKSVVIAHDSRHMSIEFADEAAKTLAANGIKAYVFNSLRPTPELSFAVRQLGCTSGINITASHNPSNYNGYKVYWEDGAQITPPHDIGIMDEISKLDFSDSKTMPLEEAIIDGLYVSIGKEIDDIYIETIKKYVLHQDLINKYGKDLKIVYTPLHGTGLVLVKRILDELGFTNVYVVKEQAKPDGDFTTVPYPNPEAAASFELGLKLAKEVDADVILATDPDADRLGCYVKDKAGEYHVLTGNVSGCLIADYEIGQRKALKGIPEDSYLVKTIVSTNLSDAIARGYNLKLIECLTGFKNIGRVILEAEEKKEGTYQFGFEESYGCLIGDYARDKDAISATMAICEAACFYMDKGMNLWDAVLDMYEKYGYYVDSISTVTMEGKAGLQEIDNIMTNMRNNPPKEIGGLDVLAIRDYERDVITNLQTGETKPTGLPKSNVLYYELGSDFWACARPSGTEPKIKFYYGVVGSSLANADELLNNLGKAVNQLPTNYK